MHYQCSECGKPVGLMADKTGAPQMFLCPNTGRVASVQTPVKRGTTPRPVGNVATQFKKRRDDDEN